MFISLEDYKDTSCHKIEKGTSNEDDDEEYPILALNMLDNAHLNEALNTLRFLEWNPKDDRLLILIYFLKKILIFVNQTLTICTCS